MREKIKKVLGPLFRSLPLGAEGPRYDLERFFDTLAEQIAIEMEVEHSESEGGIKITDVLTQHRPSLGIPYRSIIHSIEGHHGPPGKYLFIGLPLTPSHEGEGNGA